MADTSKQSALAFSADPSQPTFNFSGHTIRIIVRDSEPWFVAKDVMAALGYSGHSAPAKVCEHIPEEWKGVNPIHTLGGQQKLLCLSEPGLYFFLGRSDKQTALPFQKWVYGEVLPSIRKTGGYEQPRQLPIIDPRNLLMSGQCALQTTMPQQVQEAINRKALGLAMEAFELCREHLTRRVAYEAECGSPKAVNLPEALQVVERGGLADALAHQFHSRLGHIIGSMEGHMRLTQAYLSEAKSFQ